MKTTDSDMVFTSVDYMTIRPEIDVITIREHLENKVHSIISKSSNNDELKNNLMIFISEIYKDVLDFKIFTQSIK